MKFIHLSEEEFEKFRTSVLPDESPPEAPDEWTELEEQIDKGLAEYWDSSASMLCFCSGALWWKKMEPVFFSDYGMLGDYINDKHHNLGILTRRIHCRKFIEILQGALDRKSSEWSISVNCVCEPLGTGEILLHEDKIYCKGGSTLDYEHWFTTSNYRRKESPLSEEAQKAKKLYYL